MTVETIEGLKSTTGWPYQRLCCQTGVGYSSMRRWRDRLEAGRPLVRRPGPGKKRAYDHKELQGAVRKLKHCRQLTRGSGDLYEQYREQVSRREYQHMVVSERRDANRLMRRIGWNVPGLAWTLDDTGRRGLPIECRMSMNQVRDLCSRKVLSAKVGEKLLKDDKVAKVLMELFDRHGAPLFGKRDNGSNLNGSAVNEVFTAYGVIALNSPAHHPRYNGLMEWGQREMKQTMAVILAGCNAGLEDVSEAAELASGLCNGRERPCLSGQTSDVVFETRHEAMRVYTIQRRREVHDEITTMAGRIMTARNRNDRLTEQAAWRIAVETWLRREGLITIRAGGKVLPYYEPLFCS